MMSFSGNTLSWNGASLRLPFRIVDARQQGVLAIVLFDPDEEVGAIGQFQNLRAYDRNGNEVWRAELPTTTTGDAYYQVSSWQPLTADSVCSEQCTIDPADGKIVGRTFVK